MMPAFCLVCFLSVFLSLSPFSLQAGESVSKANGPVMGSLWSGPDEPTPIRKTFSASGSLQVCSSLVYVNDSLLITLFFVLFLFH